MAREKGEIGLPWSFIPTPKRNAEFHRICIAQRVKRSQQRCGQERKRSKEIKRGGSTFTWYASYGQFPTHPTRLRAHAPAMVSLTSRGSSLRLEI